MEIIQVAILILILILFLFFIFYRKIIHVTSIFISFIFFLSILCALSTIFLPRIYESGTEILIMNSRFGTQLKTLDNSITQIGNLPNDLLDSIGNIFGQNNEREGYKSDLYGQFIDFSAVLIRIMILIFSLIIMVVSVYIRYSYSGLIEADKMRGKIEELEKEVNLLKQLK